MLPRDADPFFRLDVIAPARPAEPVGVAAGFAVVVVLDGEGALAGGDGSLDIARARSGGTRRLR